MSGIIQGDGEAAKERARTIGQQQRPYNEEVFKNDARAVLNGGVLGPLRNMPPKQKPGHERKHAKKLAKEWGVDEMVADEACQLFSTL